MAIPSPPTMPIFHPFPFETVSLPFSLLDHCSMFRGTLRNKFVPLSQRSLFFSGKSPSVKSLMNVTRHNLTEMSPQFTQAIAECAYIAIDTEFTGLSISDAQKEQWMDSLEERYTKVREAGQSFLITQFGITTIHFEEADTFSMKTWNFYIFPRPYGLLDERFLCQASSLQFLSEHGFNFNKFIADGIPFLSMSNQQKMHRKLQREIRHLNNKIQEGQNPPKKPLSKLTDKDQLFMKDIEAQIEDWMSSKNARSSCTSSTEQPVKKMAKTTDEKLRIACRNSFERFLCHQTVERNYPELFTDSERNCVCIFKATPAEREAILTGKIVKVKEEYENAVGFNRIIETMSKSKKPIIGHNALLDFVYLYQQFVGPLPSSLREFKEKLTDVFPVIYDTKHLILREPKLNELYHSTSLGNVFEDIREKIFPNPESFFAEGFEDYIQAATAKSDAEDDEIADESNLAHEAGFDSFMTGVVFMGLRSNLQHENRSINCESDSDGKKITNLPAEMSNLKNCLNLMRSDARYLDLNNLDQDINRQQVYYVSILVNENNKKAKKFDELFAEGQVERVVRQNNYENKNQYAFVYLNNVLTDGELEDLNKVWGDQDIKITKYYDYLNSQNDEQRNDAIQTEKVKDTATSWGESCVIS